MNIKRKISPPFQRPWTKRHSWVCMSISHSVMSDSLQPPGLQPARLLCPWASPGKVTGEGCHALLQENIPDPGIEPSSLASPTLAGGFLTTSATWEAQSEMDTHSVRQACKTSWQAVRGRGDYGGHCIFSFPPSVLWIPENTFSILFLLKSNYNVTFHKIRFVQLIKHQTVPGLTIKPGHSTHLLW